MRRALALAAGLVLGIAAAAPAVLAAEPLAQSGRVLVSTQGDITVPAGEQADFVVVVDGTANIQGTVNTLVVVEGSAILTGARIETVVAVRSSIEVGIGTVVLGEIQRLDATVHETGNAQIVGGITDLAGELTRFGAILAPALALLWLGFGLATIVAALALAGLGARQVRATEAIITRDPLMTGFAGFVSLILVPMAAAALFATIIGAPLAFALLFQLLPLVAFVGYLAAGIWLGEAIMRRLNRGPEPERPYLAAVVGVVALQLLAVVPVIGFAVAILSLLGLGAVVRYAIQTLRGAPRPFAGVSQQVAAPSAA